MSISFKFAVGFLSILCILVSIFASTILCSYFRSIPYIKKNILTRLDELYVLNYTFFVCSQSCVCLFSLLTTFRNDYLYLAFYIILYGSFTVGFCIAIGLSLARVLIIMSVSNNRYFILLTMHDYLG